MKEFPCYIYVIATLRGGNVSAPFKVGISHQPERRLSQIQTSCPFPVEIVGALYAPNKRVARVIENAFHRTWSENQSNGEWFDGMSLRDGVEWLCESYRDFLYSLARSPEHQFSSHDIDFLVEQAGINHALRRCANERYLAAWESLAA